MSETLWESEITLIGPEAQDMFDAGVIILYGEPVPPALSDVSIVHNTLPTEKLGLQAGDFFHLGDSPLTITKVGELAEQNFLDLGHFVIYINPEDQNLLPGAVHATGDFSPVTAGQTMKITRQ